MTYGNLERHCEKLILLKDQKLNEVTVDGYKIVNVRKLLFCWAKIVKSSRLFGKIIKHRMCDKCFPFEKKKSYFFQGCCSDYHCLILWRCFLLRVGGRFPIHFLVSLGFEISNILFWLNDDSELTGVGVYFSALYVSVLELC